MKILNSFCRSLLLTISFVVLFVSLLRGQMTIENSIMHDGLERNYITYIPELYTEEYSVPLILNFHGLGSNAMQQMQYGDFRAIADTANFIVVHPQGTNFFGLPHWNVGGFTLGSMVDDVGFTGALIDEILATYSIDPDRIYSTGMSNGGYMSFLLACQLSDRIAAVASVTGSMTPEIYNACDPLHPTPVVQIHGVDDGVVPYEGEVWSKPITEVLSYWVQFNDCNPDPYNMMLQDINTSDNSTVEHLMYTQGDRGVNVEHFKIAGGGHTWPGNAVGGGGTNYDFNASEAIWNFFARYDINGIRGTVSLGDISGSLATPSIYPNPAQRFILVQSAENKSAAYDIISLAGFSVKSGVLDMQESRIDISDLAPGVYIFKSGEYSTKWVKMK